MDVVLWSGAAPAGGKVVAQRTGQFSAWSTSDGSRGKPTGMILIRIFDHKFGSHCETEREMGMGLLIWISDSEGHGPPSNKSALCNSRWIEAAGYRIITVVVANGNRNSGKCVSCRNGNWPLKCNLWLNVHRKWDLSTEKLGTSIFISSLHSA